MRRRARITAALLLVASVLGLVTLQRAQAATGNVERFWAVGDMAKCPDGEPAILGARNLMDDAGDTRPIAVLGDLAYPDGSTQNFNSCFNPAWGPLKSRMKPVAGNHEYNTAGAAPYRTYFNDVPRWYAWEKNGWQMLAVDSNCDKIGGCGAGSPVYTWLEAQLRDDPHPCQVAYWHHPRWSQAMHGPSTAVKPLYDLLVKYGVELLLAGHDHNYQRFAALDAGGKVSSTGVVEIVVGTGGADHNTGTKATGPAPVRRNDTAYGALLVELGTDDWSTVFVPEASASFTDTVSGECHDGPGSTVPTTTTTQAPGGSTTTLDQSGPTTTTTPGGDTQEPNSAVSAPALNATVTSPVGVTGTATDDVGVDEVKVGLRNTATGQWLQADGSFGTTFRQYPATLANRRAASTSWTISFANIPNGSYALSVKAFDNGGRAETTTPWVPFKVSGTGGTTTTTTTTTSTSTTTTTTTTQPPGGSTTTTTAPSSGDADDIWAFWGYLYSDGKKQSNGTWRWDQVPHRFTASEARFQRGAAALGIGVVRESSGAWITNIIASLEDPRTAPEDERTRAVQAYLSSTIEDEAVCGGMVYDNISAPVIQYVGDLYRSIGLSPTVKTYSGGFMELLLPQAQWPDLQSWPWATKVRTPGAPECTLTVK